MIITALPPKFRELHCVSGKESMISNEICTLVDCGRGLTEKSQATTGGFNSPVNCEVLKCIKTFTDTLVPKQSQISYWEHFK